MVNKSYGGNMESKEAVLRKIQKLFSLSENNPSMEEAQAAMLKAQMLLLNNGISEEEAKAYAEKNSDPSLSDVIVDSVNVEKTTNKVFRWQIDLAYAICPNFRVEFLMTSTPSKGNRWNSRRGKTFRLIGMSRDVDACKETLEFALRIAPVLWKTYWKEWKKDNPYAERLITEGEKSSYMSGFSHGIKERFAEQVTTKDLIVVTPEAVINRRKQLTGGTYHGARGSQYHGSAQSYRRGVADGKTFGNGKGRFITA